MQKDNSGIQKLGFNVVYRDASGATRQKLVVVKVGIDGLYRNPERTVASAQARAMEVVARDGLTPIMAYGA